MSLKGVFEFIEKALTDVNFRDSLQTDWEIGLSQFDLTQEEKMAIRIGIEEPMKNLEIDDRLSKAGILWGMN